MRKKASWKAFRYSGAKLLDIVHHKKFGVLSDKYTNLHYLMSQTKWRLKRLSVKHSALSPGNINNSKLHYFLLFKASQRANRNCRQASCIAVSKAVMRLPY
jgi:hypothetical protein